jgi:hypothetical protein
VTDPDLENRFLYHPPTPAAAWRHAAVNSLTLEFARKLVKLTPASREQSLALTRLKEAQMWANGAVACNHGLLTPAEEPTPTAEPSE